MTPTTSRSSSPRPPTWVTTTIWPTCATSAAGSVAWSATTSPTSSLATATRTTASPRRSPTTSRAAQGYDYNQHGQAGNTHADFVPDEIVDRFCILGPPEEHLRRLARAPRSRRRPVRDLPPARRQGPHAARVRRERHPAPRRARAREVVIARGARAAIGVAVISPYRRRCSLRSPCSWSRLRLGVVQARRPRGRRFGARPADHPEDRPTGRCRTPGTWSQRLGRAREPRR